MSLGELIKKFIKCFMQSRKQKLAFKNYKIGLLYGAMLKQKSGPI